MLSEIRDFINKNKNLVNNVRALFTLQMVNYVLPLVTVPYVVRVIGIDNFGLLSFGVAVAGYCNLVCDYGFNLSATREISLYRHNQNQLLKIYSTTLTVKAILCCFCFFVVLVLCNVIELFASNLNVLIYSFSLVVAQALFPVWFFQGMENMGTITRISIFSKTIFTILIFVFVKTEDDFLLIPIFTGVGYLAGSLTSMLYARKHYGMKYELPKVSDLFSTVSSGFPLFLSSISISFYTLSAPIILSFTSTAAAVGAFSSAEKIVQALKALFSPITQAFYPYMSKLLASDIKAGMTVVRTILIPFICIGLFISALVFYNSEILIKLIFGSDFLEAVIYLKIMSLIPTLVLVSNVLGIQIMLNLGCQREFTRIIAWTGICSITVAVLAAHQFGATGIAWGLLCTEFTVVILFYMFLHAKLAIIHNG